MLIKSSHKVQTLDLDKKYPKKSAKVKKSLTKTYPTLEEERQLAIDIDCRLKK